MRLPSELRDTIVAVSVVMAEAHDPWWIITSAAAALHGAEPIHVNDVDVLLSVSDAYELLPRLGLAAKPGPGDSEFRSEVFAVWADPPLRVEFMAAFQSRDLSGWQLVEPTTRRQIGVGNAMVFVPELWELAAMFRRFGRPKDLERMRALNALVETR